MHLPMSPDSAFIKIYCLLIFSAISRHSDEGFRATIKAFDNHKVCIYIYIFNFLQQYFACGYKLLVNH